MEGLFCSYYKGETAMSSRMSYEERSYTPCRVGKSRVILELIPITLFNNFIRLLVFFYFLFIAYSITQ